MIVPIFSTERRRYQERLICHDFHGGYMQTLFRLSALLISASLAACGTTGSVSSLQQATSLTDTAWTLLAYRPAATGSEDIQPARREHFRLHFLADGRLTAQIDCNRGSGNWKVTSTKTDGGGLHISAVSLTRMMCPPDRIGDLLPQQIESVQSYRIVDGRLYLELGAANGQYVWARSEP